MEIRNRCELSTLYAKPQEGIRTDSPEILFMQAVADEKYDEAASIFREKKQFTEVPPVVDAPYGRFEGREAIRDFAAGFVKRFEAEGLSVRPMFQTRAGGRSVSELVLSFVRDGMIDEVPMFAVADLGAQNTLEEVRLYCHCTFVPHMEPYRRPMFPSAHLEMGDPGLLTGAVKEYYVALHHVPSVDVERILACMHPDCVFGGYGPYNGHPHESGMEALRRTYTGMASYIPAKVAMRYETIIDDGVTGVIEWVHVIADKGREDLQRVALSGIAAYMRGEDGRLCSIRISDYAGYEKYIDWSKMPITKAEAEAVNAVHEFPAGVGRKPQEIL